MNIKSVIKGCLPRSQRGKASKIYQKLKFAFFIRKLQWRYAKVEVQLKKKEKIKICFFLIHDSVWKLDELFKMMLADERFEPIVVICPYIAYGQETMLYTMDKAEQFIKSKEYPYVVTYNRITGEWLDVRRELKPDIVFFTNPHGGLTRKEYYIYNYPNSLTCYVPYSSNICAKDEFDIILPNLVWRSFLENNMTQSIAREQSPIKATNTVVTGFPSLDIMQDKSYVAQNVWKHHQQIKIIWAPHHTIERGQVLEFSNFLEFAEPMKKLAKKYQDQIQIAFKPHPILKSKLVEFWGEERTQSYYDFWTSQANTQLEQGTYADLFHSSSAMIFDSISFTTEYIYTLKPSLFIYNKAIDTQLNRMGLLALDCHQKATSINQIEEFVVGLIKGVPDPKLEQKQNHFVKYLTPPNQKSASQNIFDILVKVLS